MDHTALSSNLGFSLPGRGEKEGGGGGFCLRQQKDTCLTRSAMCMLAEPLKQQTATR